MGKNPSDSLHLLLKESGSTSRVDNPSDSVSECLIDVTLPQELITEILVRLPVKSLSRFKCVSKPWLSLISNPQFIRSHFSKSTCVEACDLNLELLFATNDGMKKCCLYSALQDSDLSKHVTDIEFPAHNTMLVGIINGLVCFIFNGNDLCVCNPALNKFQHLNVHPEAPSGGHVEYFYSFGYDESNDDYKVVCLQTAEVSICSLKADSWRRIDRLNGFYLPHPGVFANGKIYWSEDEIVSLDVSSEKLVELQQPEYDAGDCMLKMEVSGGRPFVFCHYEGMKLDLWVLDKDGVDESWSKLVSIPFTDLNHKYICSFFYRALCISRNFEIVFGDEYDLIVYNWKKKESRNINLGVGMTLYWDVAAYVESLVWPYYA